MSDKVYLTCCACKCETIRQHCRKMFGVGWLCRLCWGKASSVWGEAVYGTDYDWTAED